MKQSLLKLLWFMLDRRFKIDKILKFTRRSNSNINGYAIEIINMSHMTNICLANKTVSIYVDESPTIPSEYFFESEQTTKNEFDRIIGFLTNDFDVLLEVKYD